MGLNLWLHYVVEYKVWGAMAIALLVIGVTVASAIVTLLLEGHFVRTASLTETGTAKLSSKPFNSSLYLSSDVGPCKGPAGYAPCFGGGLSQAEVFNCMKAASLPLGCTQHVVSSLQPQNSYHITIWYPYVGHSNESSCQLYLY